MSVIRPILLLALSTLPILGATSYANPGGTGNRTSTITVTCSSSTFCSVPANAEQLVNGNLSETGFFFNGVPVAGEWIQFDFGSGNYFVIDESTFYQQTSAAQATWKWQGSETGSSWTDLGSSFSLGGTTTQPITSLSGNTTQYRYYRILGVSGSANNGPWIYEFEFKISLVMGPPPSSSSGGYAVVM